MFGEMKFIICVVVMVRLWEGSEDGVCDEGDVWSSVWGRVKGRLNVKE